MQVAFAVLSRKDNRIDVLIHELFSDSDGVSLTSARASKERKKNGRMHF